jgi:fructose-bisphosphate aldolase class 1
LADAPYGSGYFARWKSLIAFDFAWPSEGSLEAIWHHKIENAVK